jgi:hypothetical protein
MSYQFKTAIASKAREGTKKQLNSLLRKRKFDFVDRKKNL